MTTLSEPSSKRILTGDRPTGRLHLGHLVGSLQNRVALQRDYDTILIVADLHTLTTRREPGDIEAITGLAREMVLDNLAAGVDPARCTLYLQSAVPEVYQLAGLLQNLVQVNRLLRLPTIKEMSQHAGGGLPLGLLGYPVLQAADILMARAELVPVGPDNLPHVEITREIARRFNETYGRVFPEPEPLLGVPKALPGTDNLGKMSKSAGNAIFLSDPTEVVRRKVRRMYTDPNRVHAHIPGDPDGNPVFAYHRAFNPDAAEVAELEARYRAGRVGDVEVKDRLAEVLEDLLEPMRARRAALEADRGAVDELLVEGSERVREIARGTLREVRYAMGVDRAFTRLRRGAERRRKRGRG
jgi:tryptophanyl-tRNA synthetase